MDLLAFALSTAGGTKWPRSVPWDVLEHGWGNEKALERSMRRAGARLGLQKWAKTLLETCYKISPLAGAQSKHIFNHSLSFRHLWRYSLGILDYCLFL